jgi:NADPH:quinone reductase-like Zn-dependent oxidoreductase
MRAVRIDHFGDPAEALRVVDVSTAPLPGGQARVKIEAAAINPSDILNVRGSFHSSLPCTVGRDFAGQVVEGPREVVGLEVWGSGGDAGVVRDGAHAEQIDIPLEAVSRRPSNLSAPEAAAVGVPYVTAWSAFESAQLGPGETVLVSGAAGAVGTAATELAHARGARVIALVRNESEEAKLDLDRVQAVAHSDLQDTGLVVSEATGGRGVAVALNGVGAPIFPSLLASLADEGRMVVYGSGGGAGVQLDLTSLYRRSLRLIGLNTVSINLAGGAHILSELAPMFESGKLRAPQIAARYRLEEAVAAYARAASGPGKVVFAGS